MFALPSLMSLGGGIEDCGEERHAQQAGWDTTLAALWGLALDCGEERHAHKAGQDATLEALQLVELWGLALDFLQAFMTGIAVQTQAQAHVLARQGL